MQLLGLTDILPHCYRRLCLAAFSSPSIFTRLPCATLPNPYSLQHRQPRPIAQMATSSIPPRSKAVQIVTPGPISNLVVNEVDTPKPGPGQLLIKNIYAGVNFIDTYHRSGLYTVQTPFTIGVDGGGEIAELGPDVDTSLGLSKGDVVAYSAGGSYAEYVVANAKNVVKVPPGLDLADAVAAVVQGMTAYYLATQVYPVKAGDWVLIPAAAGGTGRILTQIVAATGAHVIAVTSTPEKAAIAKELGAEHTLSYSQPDFLDVVKKLADGQGVHVVFDGVGAATWETSKKALRHLGVLVSFGNASGKVPAFELASITPNNIKVTRPSLYEGIKHSPAAWRQLADEVLGLVTTGKVKLHVQEVIPLEQAAKAHQLLESRATIGKILLKV